jgi:hypothetical protein
LNTSKALFLLALAACGLCCGCQRTEFAETEQYVSRFIERTENLEFDKSGVARQAVTTHPRANPFGWATKYTSITDNPTPYPRLNVVLRSEIVSLEKHEERVDRSLPPGQRQYGYFAKVKHSVIAATRDGQLTVLSAPEEATEYLILAKDPSDGKYRYIDRYPVANAAFVRIDSFLANLENWARYYHGVVGPDVRNELDKYRR